MNQKKTGLIFSYIYSLANIVIGLFMSTFVLHKLGITEYGVYQTVAAFATYLILFEFGVGTVMSRNIAVCRGHKSDITEVNHNISTVFFITVVLSALILAVSAAFYFNIGRIYQNTLTDIQISYGKWLFLGITLYILLTFWNQTFTGICNGYELFNFTKKLALICLLVRTVMIIVLLSLSPSSFVLVLSDIAVSFCSLIATIVYSYKRIGYHIRISFLNKQILHFSMPMAFALFLQSLVNQANNNVDKFLISILLSPESVSVYAIGMFVYTSFAGISTIPISIFQPSVVKRISASGIDDSLTDFLVGPSRLLMLTGGTILFGFLACGIPFINVFYGKEYMDAWYVAIAVMIPMFLNMSYGILVNILDALGKRMVRSVLLLATTVANVLLTIVAIRYYGIVGAALATAVCTLIGQVIAMNLYYQKGLGINIFQLTKKMFHGMLPSLILSCVLAFLAVCLLKNQFVALLVGMLVYLISLATFLWLFGFNQEEKSYIRQNILAKLQRKQ